MNKLFKPRCMRRIILFFSLAFPMVYLMGTAFFALNGSHGNVLLSQDENVTTSSQLLDFNQIRRDNISGSNVGVTFSTSEDGTIHYEGIVSQETTTATRVSYVPLVFNHTYAVYFNKAVVTGSFGTLFYIYRDGSLVQNLNSKNSSFSFVASYDDSYISLATSFIGMLNQSVNVDIDMFITDLTQMYGAGNEPTLSDFLATFPKTYYSYVTSKLIVLETTETPTYSEYLFNQVFGHDNIVTQLGYYALSEEQKGFAPLSSLIRFVDTNILKWGTDNSVALFTYGYLYYAMNVIIVYEIAVIAIKLLLLPLKAIDVFDKGEDKHD